MRALVFDGRDLRVRDHAEPGPLLLGVPAGAGAPSIAIETAVVRPLLAGICNTDLEIARGYMGFEGVLGHEVLGIVEAGPAAWCGRRVVCEINFSCGATDCAACTSGLGRHCPRRSVMGILRADGGFAESVAVPVANLHAVPDGVRDECAVFTEPLAAAFEVLEQVPVAREWRCLVLGDGKLGCLVAQVLAPHCAQVRVVGHHTQTIDWLRRRDIDGLLERDWTNPEAERADLVVDATGSARAFELAARATRPRGTLVLKSTVAERTSADLAPLVINEVSVVGSRCGPFAPALAALAAASVEVEGLIAQRNGLEDATGAFETAARRGVRKVLIDLRA